MLDDLIKNAAKLMREQTAAYRRLETACNQLSAALVSGKPETIESLTRAGEETLLGMRVRLVQLMTALAAFADKHPGAEEGALGPETRIAFRDASDELFRAARDFQRAQARAAAVASNGAAFAAAGIELCGVPPTTYRAPYSRRGEGRAWG
ncbi:MAG: hypothetical protein SF339_05575 [Blastocatellia bacterium]|nr:hypothetical protein [Blastocatellia bacterium]